MKKYCVSRTVVSEHEAHLVSLHSQQKLADIGLVQWKDEAMCPPEKLVTNDCVAAACRCVECSQPH